MRYLIPVMLFLASCSDTKFKNPGDGPSVPGTAYSAEEGSYIPKESTVVTSEDALPTPGSSGSTGGSGPLTQTPLEDERPSAPGMITGALMVCQYLNIPQTNAASIGCFFRDANGAKVAVNPSKVELTLLNPITAQLTTAVRKATVATSGFFAWIDLKSTDGSIATSLSQLQIQVRNLGGSVAVSDETYVLADIVSPATKTVGSVSSLTPVLSPGKITLSWTGSGSIQGFLIVRLANSAVSWMPSNGVHYGTGYSEAGHDVIYQGAALSFEDGAVLEGTTYGYRAIAYDADFTYSLTPRDISVDYSTLVTCGIAGDSCYKNTRALAAGLAKTPSGKMLEYVPSSGDFSVWKEVGGSRILKPDGSDNWAKRLNPSGKGFATNDFLFRTDIIGRACPNNVYIDDSSRFTTGNCLYYTAEAGQPLNANGTNGILGLGAWPASRWYVGNVAVCSNKGMRLPAVFETDSPEGTNNSAYPYANGSPTFSPSTGVPTQGYTFTATSYNTDVNQYIIWSATSGNIAPFSQALSIVCVIP